MSHLYAGLDPRLGLSYNGPGVKERWVSAGWELKAKVHLFVCEKFRFFLLEEGTKKRICNLEKNLQIWFLLHKSDTSFWINNETQLLSPNKFSWNLLKISDPFFVQSSWHWQEKFYFLFKHQRNLNFHDNQSVVNFPLLRMDLFSQNNAFTEHLNSYIFNTKKGVGLRKKTAVIFKQSSPPPNLAFTPWIALCCGAIVLANLRLIF